MSRYVMGTRYNYVVSCNSHINGSTNIHSVGRRQRPNQELWTYVRIILKSRWKATEWERCFFFEHITIASSSQVRIYCMVTRMCHATPHSCSSNVHNILLPLLLLLLLLLLQTVCLQWSTIVRRIAARSYIYNVIIMRTRCSTATAVSAVSTAGLYK